MANKALEPSRVIEILLALSNGPLSSSEIQEHIASAEGRSRKRTAGSRYGYYPRTPLPSVFRSNISRLRTDGVISRDPETGFYSLSELGEARINELMALYTDLYGMPRSLEDQDEKS